ncbi:MAG TPA: hypothetical protein ENK30_04500, partial [Anaerolineae bacterium]|nr:hypothetical protein [Anaerolineae bacterium]
MTLPPTEFIPGPRENFLRRVGRDPRRWRARLRLVLFAIVMGAVIFIVQTVDFPGAGNVKVEVGQPSPKTVVSPISTSYTSEVLTNEAREQARENVQPIYDLPDTRVARRQIARAQDVIAFITQVRNDPYATREEKIAWLQAIPELHLT